ncbi:hypothetical protein Pmar_PMAR023329 [Perkinsus marinus ATCC 50983]|uniref:Uncharacterized protein n=1 Tax=Perkinsus marinus (strain ATCC 50983 / TXsc) TaxID=423536 RepID=C5KK94_PERM5|nr:hypothetical protein Pmar_PMAR023329 [Perkinsus marinus ATCC 50983]EER15006.1 hypothetical protein Pmar_PMAR023329 [Perkinsus marinus ATCC 50983]|eukprot:XP_002783210.1 hypothetical protein Pmar_PMAR023329 [Perkinsus marinus ATCC 50983]
MSSSQINQEDASPDQHFYSPDSLLSSEKTESTLRRSGRLQGHLPPPDPSLITRAHSSAEVVQHANNDTEVNSHVHNNISDDPALKLPSTRNNDINDNDDLPHDNHVNDDHGEPPYAESMEEELQDAIPQHSQPSTISTTPGAQPHDLHLRLLRPRTSTTPDANVIADQPPPVLTSLPPRYSEHHVRQYQSSAVDNVPNNHKSYPAGTGLQHNHPQYHTRGAAMRDQAQGAEAAPRFGRGTLPLVDLTTTTTPTPNPNDAATVAALHAVTDALANITDRLMKLEEKSNAPSTLNVVDTAKNAISTHKTSIAPTNSVRISPVASATCLDSHDDNLYTDALTKAMLTASRIRPTPDSQLFTGASDKNVETFLHEITSDFRYILSDSNMKIALLLSSMSQPTIAHVTSLYTAKYGSITETVGIDADTFLSRLIEVLREAYTTSTAHMDARLSWESLLLQGHVSFVDFINKFQKLRTEVGALRGRIIEPAEALGRLWGCLPPSLRNWASDYLPPPAAQDLTERQLHLNHVYKPTTVFAVVNLVIEQPRVLHLNH